VLSRKVIRVLGRRLRRLVSLIEELSLSTVRGRSISRLIRLADKTGQRTPSGLQFELTENNEELAARLGTVRELVSRNLGRLHGAGLIEMKRRVVRIPDSAALRVEIMNE
jgi:CRP/FNR family transcriptional regulator